MGFNIQEYELAKKDNYSNAIGFGCELIMRKDKKAACEAARDVRKGNVSVPTVEDEPISTSKKPALSNTNTSGDTSETTDTQKSNTAMYIGIGVGVLAIGIVAIILIRRK
jgi:hypothetical protein